MNIRPTEYYRYMTSLRQGNPGEREKILEMIRARYGKDRAMEIEKALQSRKDRV